MIDAANKQKLITVIGGTFVEFVVWDLIAEAFEAYKKRDFSRKYFQTSIWEHGHAAAAIVLTVIGIEAYRNRIYYIERKRVSRRTNAVVNDLCGVLKGENNAFPDDKIKELLTEVFIIRDVIAHNHIYEVEVVSDQDWNMIGHKQSLLRGYGFDSKYRTYVNKRTRKTKLLKLNVQPAKIGFEDLFKVFVVLDLLIGITQNILSIGHIPFHVYYKVGDHWFKNISEILTYYLDKIPNKRFIKDLEVLSKQFRYDYEAFLPPDKKWDYFITNICPKCLKLGFSKNSRLSSCSKCGLKIGSVESFK